MKLKLKSITKNPHFNPVPVQFFTLSQDGSLLLAREDTTGKPKKLFIWDTVKQKLIKTLHTDSAYALTFLSGKQLVLDNKGVLEIWDYEEEKKLRELRIDYLVDRCSHFCEDFANDGKMLLISPGHWRAFYWNTEQNTYIFCNYPYTFSSAGEVSSDGNILYTTVQAVPLDDYEPVPDHSEIKKVRAVAALNRTTGVVEKHYGNFQNIQANYTDGNYATNVVVFEEENTIVIGYKSGLIRAYDLTTGQIERTYQLKGAFVQMLFKTCNNQIAAIGEYESSLTLWSFGNKKPESTISIPARAEDDEWDYPYFCSTEDGRYLAMLCNEMRKVFVYDFAKNEKKELDLVIDGSLARMQQMDMRNNTLYMLDREGGIHMVKIAP